ncbi:MAG: hypothetical protein WAT79_14605 [Saprospiraceae bacterium]
MAKTNLSIRSIFILKDAVGNKDTVLIGYDDNIPTDEDGVIIDSMYGEILKSMPFNHGLDVRVGPFEDGKRDYTDRR